MAFSDAGLNALLDGAIAVGTHLAPCTADPGTTGTGIDTGVTPLAAGWGTPAGASVQSSQVDWSIPQGGGVRDYTHFAVIDGADPVTAGFIAGGALDQAEQFSNNGGTLQFTGTLTTQNV